MADLSFIGKNPVRVRRSNLSTFKCLVSLDPYALWILEIPHFSRFVEFFLFELLILRKRATKIGQ